MSIYNQNETIDSLFIFLEILLSVFMMVKAFFYFIITRIYFVIIKIFKY